MMGRGRHATMAELKKRQDPRHALTRLVTYLSPYKFTLVLVLLFVLIYILLGLQNHI